MRNQAGLNVVTGEPDAPHKNRRDDGGMEARITRYPVLMKYAIYVNETLYKRKGGKEGVNGSFPG